MLRQLIIGYSVGGDGEISVKILKQTHRGEDFNEGIPRFGVPEVDMDLASAGGPEFASETFFVRGDCPEADGHVLWCDHHYFERVCDLVLSYNRKYSKNRITGEDVIIPYKSRGALEAAEEP